jgi:hypothetical protein
MKERKIDPVMAAHITQRIWGGGMVAVMVEEGY